MVDEPGASRSRASHAAGPLRLIERAEPEPGPGELLIRVVCCGVCRTDLHLAEGDLPPKHPDLTPGHEVVGEVVSGGPGATRFGPGDRVGVAWLAGTDGSCRYCRRGRENLCPASPIPAGTFRAVMPSTWSRPTPTCTGCRPASLTQSSPRCCARASSATARCAGRRSRRADLGIWGFGGSAHLTAQMAIAQGAAVHVFTRSAADRELALELGAASARRLLRPGSPEPLDSAIMFAPAGNLVPARAAGPGPGRHAGRRGDLPQRDSRA